MEDLLRGFKGDPVSLTYNPRSEIYHGVVSKCRILRGRYLSTPWLSSPHLQTAFLTIFGQDPAFDYKRNHAPSGNWEFMELNASNRVTFRFIGLINRRNCIDDGNPLTSRSNNAFAVSSENLFPYLDKVVFLDDDLVIQRDLSPLWEIDLRGKVNGAVETCRGKDEWVMSKRFRNYFNFSHPLIAKSLNPEECAWAYGMNIFDLQAWRKTNIRDTYHYWLKENLNSNLTMWKLGTLPPALIAFRGHVHPIDPSWHMLGLGYQNNTDLDSVRKAAVIHYNGQSKPWLEIAFKHLQPFWTKYVNYSNDFIRNCHIMEP